MNLSGRLLGSADSAGSYACFECLYVSKPFADPCKRWSARLADSEQLRELLG